MKRWVRVVVPGRRCGKCVRALEVGEPVMLVGDAELRRCLACAEEHFNATPPSNLAPIPASALPFDGKAAAAGKDD